MSRRRTVTHKLSEISFTFHSHATEEEWANPGPGICQRQPGLEWRSEALAAAAKRRQSPSSTRWRVVQCVGAANDEVVRVAQITAP
jgi:hypothetical protein